MFSPPSHGVAPGRLCTPQDPTPLACPPPPYTHTCAPMARPPPCRPLSCCPPCREASCRSARARGAVCPAAPGPCARPARCSMDTVRGRLGGKQGGWRGGARLDGSTPPPGPGQWARGQLVRCASTQDAAAVLTRIWHAPAPISSPLPPYLSSAISPSVSWPRCLAPCSWPHRWCLPAAR